MSIDSETKIPLTARQKDVLDWVSAFIDTRGFSPTVREVANGYGWSVNGARTHLEAIRRKGWVTWEECKMRTIRVL